MLRNTRLWKGVGPLTLGGLIFTGAAALADDAPPLSRQLTDLGRQALAQGNRAQARAFFKKAMDLDPTDREVVRLAMQDPAPPPAAAPIPGAAPAGDPQGQATLEKAAQLEGVYRQQLNDDISQRLQQARDQLHNGQPEAAISTLRLAQTVIRSAEGVDEATRKTLDRQLQAQLMATIRAEERIVGERAEKIRLQASGEQQMRALDVLERNQQTVNAMMVQFDSLMAQGQYNVLFNGGMGDILAANTPFYDARTVAQEARALEPNNPAPRAGMFVSTTMSFLAQEHAFEELKEYRFMLTMVDVARAAAPHPDYKVIEYPAADRWRYVTEKRIARYGKAVDMVDRDPKTKSIIAKLDEPISMSFPNETPLEDVLKYIKQATQGPNDSGIPIYVDPVGLQEAEKTLTSPITLELEGVPLKTTLRLLLKQLSLTYTVKDGMLTITSVSSDDQPTEIRVYPVADLAIIPLSLIGGGGGGMGGGMGGMGGGMGGMGGGMGGMGGGMGGMGGGMGGMGMMSVPVQDPADQSAGAGAYLQKKRN